MKAKLPVPLRPAIRDGFDEGDVMRLWRGIRARRDSRRRLRWVVAGLATVVVTGVLVLVPRLLPRASHGPLTLAAGGVPTVVLAEHEAQRLALADGSAMVARPQTKVDVLANDAKVFVTALRHGAVQVDVRPGGSRRWVVECGPVSIEVVGTAFEVERSAAQVLVSVSRGVVLVRGEGVPDHVQRLSAGERLAVRTAPVPEREPTTPAAGPPPTAPTESPAGDATEAPGPMPRSAEREPSKSPALVVPEAETLIRRADGARRAGDLVLAKRLLAQAVEASPGQASSAVAALTLARLIIDEDPARAARLLTAALGAGMPHGLEEDARARLVEARARGGDGEGARRAAREYHERFPDGARGGEVRRWAGQ